MVDGDVVEDQKAEDRRDAETGASDELRPAVADDAAEKAGDQGADERREYGEQSHVAQPFIRSTSSTSIVPRLRK